jgi:hypothetical protein
LPEPNKKMLSRFSELSLKISEADSLEYFGELISEHEKIMSRVLSLPGIKTTLFPDLDGWAKSLGACGGDFVLIASPLSRNELTAYLDLKGITTLFNFKELIRHE